MFAASNANLNALFDYCIIGFIASVKYNDQQESWRKAAAASVAMTPPAAWRQEASVCSSLRKAGDEVVAHHHLCQALKY